MNNTNDESIISKPNIIDVNADTFMTDVIEASKEKPIIVDFWAPWCEPCKQLTPLLENAVKDEREKLTLAKIDIKSEINVTELKCHEVKKDWQEYISLSQYAIQGKDF